MKREEIITDVEMPSMQGRRLDAGEKAEQLIREGQAQVAQTAAPAKSGRSKPPAQPKITARVFPEQYRWVKEEIKGYSARNPKRPRLTVDLLMRVAIDHLKEANNFDAIVAKHLS
jgi:hypothetical protein